MIEVVGAPDKVLADDLARKRDRVYVTRKSLFAAFQALMVQGYGDQLQDDSGSTRVFRDNLKCVVGASICRLLWRWSWHGGGRCGSASPPPFQPLSSHPPVLTRQGDCGVGD